MLQRHHLHNSVVIASASILIKQLKHLEVLGITKAELQELSQDVPFPIRARETVKRTLAALCCGIAQYQGLPEIQPPAEFLAAVIAVTVAPINYYACSHWLAGHQGLEATVDEDLKEDAVAIRPKTLYALIISTVATKELSDIRLEYTSYISSLKRLADTIAEKKQKEILENEESKKKK